jgi:hypothetical protein
MIHTRRCPKRRSPVLNRLLQFFCRHAHRRLKTCKRRLFTVCSHCDHESPGILTGTRKKKPK